MSTMISSFNNQANISCEMVFPNDYQPWSIEQIILNVTLLSIFSSYHSGSTATTDNFLIFGLAGNDKIKEENVKNGEDFLWFKVNNDVYY